MKRLTPVLVAWCLFALPAGAAEERLGPEILLDVTAGLVTGQPAVASDGLGAFVVWIADNELRGARVDGAGNVNGPFLLATSTTGDMRGDPAVASNGRGALVAWGEVGDRTADINVMLLDIDGSPVHAGPLTIDRSSASQLPFDVGVASDGFIYQVLWQRYREGKVKNYTQRVGTDGSRWTRKTRIRARGMARYPYEPEIACLGTGQCLVTWQAGNTRIEGARLAGDKLIDSQALDLLHNGNRHDLVAGPAQYLIVATQRDYTCTESPCAVTAAVARVGSDGAGLDIDGLPIDNPLGPGPSFVHGVSGAFDGENYIATFLSEWSASCGYNAYGARVSPAGTVTNPDSPGSVVTDAQGALSIGVAATRAAAVAAWGDRRDPSTCGPFLARSVYAQTGFAHALSPPLPVRDIGSIGALALAEEQTLRFTVGTPGLDPGTTSVNVTNLPAGALFDEATRTFQWRVYPNQAGTHAGIHFEASDATQTISEDVTITVAESSLSICGRVDFFGVGMPNVALQLKTGGAKPRTVLSDADGRFCFFHLVQKAYKLRLDKLSRRDFTAQQQSVLVDGDVDGVVVAVRRRAP